MISYNYYGHFEKFDLQIKVLGSVQMGFFRGGRGEEGFLRATLSAVRKSLNGQSVHLSHNKHLVATKDVVTQTTDRRPKKEEEAELSARCY